MPRILQIVAAALVLTAPAASVAFEETVVGRIEAVQPDNRIVVAGRTAQLTPATEIIAADRRPAGACELAPGVYIEAVLVDGPRGVEASSITAALLR